jgi:hypothetical protein
MRSKNQRRTEAEPNVRERPAIAQDRAEKEFKQVEVSGDRVASPRDLSKLRKSKRRK